MGSIPGFDVIVERNGVAISVKSGSFSRLGKKWSVTIADPLVDLAFTDTWTIRRKMAGKTTTLIQDAAPTDITSNNSGKDFSRTVSGELDSTVSDLAEYAIPKTLVFCNPVWVKSELNGAKLIDGILKIPRRNVEGIWLPEIRVTHPRLPGLDFQNSDFQIVFAGSHQGIANWICRKLGLIFYSNLPDVPLIDTCTFNSGETWKSAIERNFAIWQPKIKVVGASIYILDFLKTDDPSQSPVQTIFLDNSAIASVSTKQSRKKLTSADTVDHVIVVGRRTERTELKLPTPQMGSLSDIAEPTEGEFTLVTSDDFSRLRPVMGDITFGLPGDQNIVKEISHTVTITDYTTLSKNGGVNYYPKKQTIMFFLTDGRLVGKNVTTYEYTPARRPLSTTEDEYLMCKWPRQDTLEMRLLRRKITMQQNNGKDVNQTQMSEVIEGYILFTWVPHTDGEWYRCNPKPMADHLRQDFDGRLIDVSPTSTQDAVWWVMQGKANYIGREAPELLIKRECDYNMISGAFRANSQVLDNPESRDETSLQGSKKENIFRKEFFKDGAGKVLGTFGTCYHPAHQIQHEDIDTMELAQQLADRAFARGAYDADEGTEVTVETPVPLIIEDLTIGVKLPPLQIKVNGVSRTIKGGSYLLTNDEWSWSYEGSGNSNVVKLNTSQKLTVRVPY